jgi:hypothetical protein
VALRGQSTDLLRRSAGGKEGQKSGLGEHRECRKTTTR